jgi:hypothetical protein
LSFFSVVLLNWGCKINPFFLSCKLILKIISTFFLRLLQVLNHQSLAH